MDHLARILILAVACLCAPSWAGYADAVPPQGWSQSPTPGTFNFSRQSSNAAVFASSGANTIRTTAAVNVAGRPVLVPAAMRFAANAGQFAASKAFHPAVWLGLAAAPYIIQWATSNGFELGAVEGAPGGQGWVRRIPGTGYRVVSAPAGFPQGITTAIGATPYDAFILWAAAASAADASFNYAIRSQSGNTAQMGKYTKAWGLYGVTGMSATLISAPDSLYPVSPAEFEQGMPGSNMPIPLPTLTDWDWPVELPKINPDPYPTGNPAPVVIPTGQPYWDPARQKWMQPGVRVVPAPSTSSPWRVDLQPIEIELPTPAPTPENPNPAPTPLSDPKPDPLNPTVNPTPNPLNPNGPPTVPFTTPNTNTTVTVVVNPNAPPSGSTETPKPADIPLLCEVFPDIVACQKLGSVAATPMAQSTKNLGVTKEEGFGPSNGACPANRSLALHGLTVELSYQPICTAATAIRPIILALAWLSAGLAFMGLSRKE